MKILNFITGMVLPAVEMNSFGWYVVGALVAILLLGYLLYSLVKPEKF